MRNPPQDRAGYHAQLEQILTGYFRSGVTIAKAVELLNLSGVRTVSGIEWTPQNLSAYVVLHGIETANPKRRRIRQPRFKRQESKPAPSYLILDELRGMAADLPFSAKLTATRAGITLVITADESQAETLHRFVEAGRAGCQS